MLVVLGCAASILLSAGSASAHDNTGSAITLTVNDQRVLGLAPILFTELGYTDTSGDGLIDATELKAQESAVAGGLVEAVRQHVQIKIDGREVIIIGAGSAPIDATQTKPSKYVELFFATGPHDGDVSTVALAWSFTSPGHEVLLTAPDVSVAGKLSDEGTSSFSLDAASAAYSFFASGVDHVRSGLDHLLFLVVLTFAVIGSAVTRATAWRVVKLVTAFTIGHATSLCLAYFDVVSIPAEWVEPAISLSIVAAAALALLRKGDGIRPWIAATVGLVHGLGFASSLSSLGLITTAHVSALAAFNMGIDVAQTAVVLLVILAIWLSSRVLAGRQNWVRIAVCGSAGLAGLGWTASLLAA